MQMHLHTSQDPCSARGTRKRLKVPLALKHKQNRGRDMAAANVSPTHLRLGGVMRSKREENSQLPELAT